MIYVGIDPDVGKNGVAIKIKDEYQLLNLKFFDLLDKLNELKTTYKQEEIVVYVECGFLNKSNWHKVSKGSASINAKIGNSTGRNHEVAYKIIEMCEYLNLKHFQVKPTARKLNKEQFQAITKINQRLNQEQRDACMLIFGRM